ncbi:MAG: hypothetical protein EON59_10160 [Alphaproteobacteria bacterium]|nr:MAG: hypothetical protein EON59_10160 [Alphaproteobacteria bacterium]
MSVLEAGAGLVFMRVGSHAGETLDEIIERKRAEVAQVGHAFWGYGGLNCHPRTVVQPYAEDVARQGGVVRLCLEEVPPSRETYWAEDEPAREWSIDGINFKPLPPGIRVTGSRYAFVITDLREQSFELSLTNARVAAGPSRGRLGAKYVEPVGGRVDKAVLQVEDESGEIEPGGGVQTVPISFVADLYRPYAVFLR